MSTNTRYGFKWSVNEVLSLQREFELLGWSIEQIAQKHKRTCNAIMYKLDEEGFADYNDLYNNLDKQSSPSELYFVPSEDVESELDDDDEEYVENADVEDDYEDEDDEVANLSERVDGLEESISEIKDMLKQMMTNFNESNKCKGLY